MAKNVKELNVKKKRIAHNKTLTDSHAIYPECKDFVSTIMEEMESFNSSKNLMKTICTSKSEINLLNNSKTNAQEKEQTKINPPANHTYQNHSKVKKIGLDRKHPLMEKTQRTLKQLKHNRKMPKPRAHLASLTNSESFNHTLISTNTKIKSNTNTIESKPDVAREITNFRKPANETKNKCTKDSKARPTKFQTSTMKNQASIELAGSALKKKEFDAIKKKSSKSTSDKSSKPSSDKPSKSFSDKPSTSSSDKPSKSSSDKPSKSSSDKLYKSLPEYCDKTSGNSSESDEYEEFITKVKKDLPKKCKKKAVKKAKKVLKHVNKSNVYESTSAKSESDTSDDETITQCKSYNKRKRVKKDHGKDSGMASKEVSRKCVKKINSRLPESDSETDDSTRYASSRSHKRRKRNDEKPNTLTISKDDSESEMDIADEPFHNTDSEGSDSLIHSKVGSKSNPHNLSQMDNSEYNSESNISLSSKTPENASLFDKIQPSSLLNKVSSTSNISINTSSIIDNGPKVLSSKLSPSEYSNISLAATTDPNTILNQVPVMVNSASLKVECGVTKINSAAINSSYQKVTVREEPVIDLTSDNEDNSSMPKIDEIHSENNQNESLSDFDDSDSELEIVNVLLPNEVAALKKADEQRCSNGSINAINIKIEEVSPALSDSIQNPQNCLKSNSKTEIVLQTLPNNTAKLQSSLKSIPESKTHLVKYEPAYATGICQTSDDKIENKVEIGKQCNLNSVNQQSISTNNTTVPVDFNKVKKEPCDDDIEIILDISPTSSTVPPTSDCSNVKDEKNFKAVKEAPTVHTAGTINKEQKLPQVSCSNFVDSTKSASKNSELVENGGMNSLNVKALLDDLKKEFATYQNIIQTEQSMEKSFKMLEMCQAKRLYSIKSKITRLLKGNPNNSSSCSLIESAVNKLLENSSLNNSSFLKDCDECSSYCDDDIPTLPISVQDLKALAAPINLVPLSSISEEDIKPDLSELQYVVKQESSTSDETNRKCVVCAKDAPSACKGCVKVFFCSHDCGIKYWNEGHKDSCTK